MSIVCATDFSEPAATGVAAAAALAVGLGERLCLVHVLAAPGTEAALEEVARERLGEVADGLARPGLAIEQRLVAGVPDEAIVGVAAEVGARLIVLSALGQRPASRWRLGGTAERTAQTAGLPVLVVRGGAAFEAWAGRERRLRVLLAADLSVTSDAAVRWLGALRAVGPCDVVVGHVYWPPAERRRLGIRGELNLARDPAVEEVLARELAARVGTLPGEGEVRIRVTWSLGSPVSHLLELGDEERVDLVVVGTHQRTGLDWLWHGSFSREVLHRARTSVACVPVVAAEAVAPGPTRPARSVLAATDLSPAGDRAVPHAYAGLGAGGVVHLLHVVEPQAEPAAAERAGRERALVERLRALVPPDAAGRGVETRVLVVEGTDAADAICQTAARLGVDLVCVGAHGRSGLGRLVTGSVTQAVLARSPRPVLVVPAPRPG